MSSKKLLKIRKLKFLGHLIRKDSSGNLILAGHTVVEGKWWATYVKSLCEWMAEQWQSIVKG